MATPITLEQLQQCDIRCAICNGNVPILPVIVSCGHTFCQPCWGKKPLKKCPVCKSPLTSSVKPNYMLRKLLLSVTGYADVVKDTMYEDSVQCVLDAMSDEWGKVVIQQTSYTVDVQKQVMTRLKKLGPHLSSTQLALALNHLNPPTIFQIERGDHNMKEQRHYMFFTAEKDGVSKSYLIISDKAIPYESKK